jgi:hypothetical protein
MAGVLRRWRTPLLGGIAVWLLSFPLLSSHPAPITLASAAHRAQASSSEAGDHQIFVQSAREQQEALAAMQVLAAAAASPMPLVAAPVANAVEPVAPPASQAAPAPVVRSQPAGRLV